MKSKQKVVNHNSPCKCDGCINRNYQLIRNDIIELESDKHITSYSIMINSVCDNAVTDSEYISDVSRDEREAKRIFEKLALSDVSMELLEEIIEEMV